ncbi:hypothetical protein QJS10_CPB21g01088 [Acorus calamus]|uniref:Uncharacterized protein n=1 Tax=Acorus calamus TaxID=4465 RepID=A0AAV9C4I7_ACOCL|nr:hypothetical protein QJS10_CPB21g01088 [Acorus calamus]
MGVVVVLSIPLILITIMIGFGCYFLGRYKGRREAITNPQVYGFPTIPPGSVGPKGSAIHVVNAKNEGSSIV